jgi:uncharacterized membrane protein required for colicin V production
VFIIVDIFVLLIFGVFIAIGIKKGLIITAFNAVALILSIFLSSRIYPTFSKILVGNEKFFEAAQSLVKKYLGFSGASPEGTTIQNNTFIESLPLPDILIDAIKENNNGVMHSLFNSSSLEGYISKYVASLVMNVIAMLVVFLISYGIIITLRNILESLTENLILLKLLDSACGGVLGFFQGLILIWVIVVVVIFFVPNTAFAQQLDDSFTRVITLDKNIILNMALKTFL